VISDLHTSLGARQAGLDGLRAWAKTLPEGEPAAVYLLDNGARRLQAFTTDRAALNKALEKTARMLPRSLIFADTSGDEWVAQSRQMLRNLMTVLDSLASRPEAKTVVVLTGTISTTGFIEPVGSGSNAPSRRFLTSRVWNFLGEARDAESRALLARATIVAVDPTGLETPRRRADSPGREADAMCDPRDLERPWTTWDFREDTFALIAASTGGARLGYSNDVAALLAAETRLLAARYRLGFTPPDGTSLRRDVRVEVARPGVAVRAAAGQRSLTPEAAARARFASLLLSSDPPAGDFAIALDTKGPVTKRTEDALPFDVLVPVSGVYAEDRGDERRATLELLVAAVDEEGRTSEPMVIPFSVALDKDAADGSFFRKDTNFAVDRHWKGRLFVGVRDTATSRIGAVALPIGM
jgi:VWFA-related protein